MENRGVKYADSLTCKGNKLQQPQHVISFRQVTIITNGHPTLSQKPRRIHTTATSDNVRPPSSVFGLTLFPAPTHVPTRTGTCILKTAYSRQEPPPTLTPPLPRARSLRFFPFFREARTQQWSQGAKQQEQLWGSVEDLLKTIAFIQRP